MGVNRRAGTARRSTLRSPLRSALVPAILPLLLPACSPGAPAQEPAVRFGLPAGGGAGAMQSPDQPARWASAGPDAVRLSVAGQPPLLDIACRAGTVEVTRSAAAEVGAQALFALQGPGGILRLPVDATALPGRPGYVWQGRIDGADPRLAVFGPAFTGTLPGGGIIRAPASELVRQTVRRCQGGAGTGAIRR